MFIVHNFAATNARTSDIRNIDHPGLDESSRGEAKGAVASPKPAEAAQVEAARGSEAARPLPPRRPVERGRGGVGRVHCPHDRAARADVASWLVAEEGEKPSLVERTDKILYVLS